MPVSQAWTPSASSASNSARAAAVVEMGGDLVEQQQRRAAALGRLQPRLAQKDGDQQRLLLAGRAIGGRHHGRQPAEAHEKIAAMRADRARAGLGIQGRGRPPDAARSRSSAASAGISPSQPSTSPRRARPGRGKLPSVCGQHGAEPGDQVEPRRGDGDALLGDLLLQRVEPDGLIARLARGHLAAQQARRSRMRLLIGVEAAGMAGIEAEHQPVEEAPARRFGLEEQPIHLRRQPEHGQPLGQAVEAAVEVPSMRSRRRSRLPSSAAGSRPVPMSHSPGRSAEPGGDGPGPASSAGAPRAPGRAGRSRQPRLAQAAARGEEGERLQQIGLAGAIGPGQHHRPRRSASSAACAHSSGNR